MIRRSLLGTAALTFLAAPLAAQGTLSTQGFGYPVGQLSARAAAAAGAVAEFDAHSSINPGALASWGASGFLVVYEPLFRTVEVEGAEDGARYVRFPLVAGALNIGSRATVGLAFATFLDRTGAISFSSLDTISGDTVRSTKTFRTSGAINDIRLGAAYTFGSRTRPFSIGLGIHALTGENRNDVLIRFTDTDFVPVTAQTRVSYFGLAVSGGVNWRPIRGVTVGASARQGGEIKSYIDDSTRSTADVPPRYGAAIGYEAGGAAIAVRYGWEGWSSLEGLGSEDVDVYDTQELAVGGQIDGPRIAEAAIPLRAGVRWRTLPFGVATGKVDETTIAAGAGIPLRFGRSTIDLGVQRSTRSAEDVEERGWSISVGITVRP